MRVGICMSQASRSRSKSLILAALLVPGIALAGGQFNLTPPAAPTRKAAILTPASVGKKSAANEVGTSKATSAAVKGAIGSPAPKVLKGTSVKSKPPHVIYAHAFRHRVRRLRRAEILHQRAEFARLHSQHKAAIRKKLPSDAVVVSTQGLNRFVFPAAINKGPIFPADAPVLGTPVYLDGNRQVLVQFVPGADKPFEMVVELAGHQVKSYLLVPRNVPGITFHARGVHPPRKSWTADAVEGKHVSAHNAAIDLMRSVVMGEVPDEFYPTQLPPEVRFDKFNLVPRATWSDGSGHRILVYTVVSVHGQAAVVAAPEFYHKGMTEISLSGEVVDATHSPLLYILEGANRG